MSTDKFQKPELDHIFIWTQPNGGDTARRFTELGLVETYRRQHIGQGTANICYCFENAFIELLWIVDEAEAQAADIQRCQFVERSRSGNPFGIAWRGDLPNVETWDFKPSYLPDHLSIKVACESDDIRQPFLFTFPGSKAPSDLPQDQKGALQSSAGFSALELSAVTSAQSFSHPNALYEMLKAGQITTLEEGPADVLHLKLKRAPNDARSNVDFTLPI